MKEYRLGLYEKSMPNFLLCEEKLNCAKECRFDTVEMSIDETEEKSSRLDMTIEESKEFVDTTFKCDVPHKE